MKSDQILEKTRAGDGDKATLNSLLFQKWFYWYFLGYEYKAVQIKASFVLKSRPFQLYALFW